MKTRLIVPICVLVAACSSAGTTGERPAAWPTGRFEIEATLNYVNRGNTETERRVGELTIDPSGAMSLTSSRGLCLEPTQMQKDADKARGQSSFVCGDEGWVLMPGPGNVRGQLRTTVSVEEIVTVCAEYATDANGNRVCVRSEDHIQTRQLALRAQLTSRPIR